MNYLYGDSTTSTLKSNFLEFLRDAIDFSVFVLQADAKMKEGRVRIRELTEESEAESGRLERFISSVSRSVDEGEKGKLDSPTAACGTRLKAVIADAHRASLDGIRQNLAAAIAKIEADEAAGREACLNALGTLLAPHEPPDATTVTRLGLLESGNYDATLDGKSDPALEWTLEVAIPDDHAWATPMRVENLVPHLEIRAPQLAGWITKEVKVKPQRIERYVVTEIVDSTALLTVELRMEQNLGVGFDFHVDPEKGTVVKAMRVGGADDASVGPFELHTEDVPLVVDLVKKLRTSLGGLDRRPNVTAVHDGIEFSALPGFVDFVKQLVAMMAPITREISKRSLTPNELVLRRPLGNDRREEIFVAKATLREKLAVLPDESRALFASLGLDVVDKGKAVKPSSDRPPIRSELPPSIPPPAMGKAAMPKAPATPTLKDAPPSSGRTLQPPNAVPPPKNAPPSTPPPKMPSDAPQVEVLEEVEMSSDALLEAVPESTRNLVTKKEGEPRNEALVASLKKILKLSKNGRTVDAYNEYTNLFSSAAFADYRPEEQRQALKLMVLAKSHPSDMDAVTSAHKAALTRLKALVEGAEAPEPADQELLGVTYQFLGDEKAAGTAYQAALEAERSKNPQSELIASLMKRVSQL
jgi:hypothetical protein